MAITVVLNGAANDASVIESSMRFAVQQRCLLRLVVGAHGNAELVEQQLDFARWFLTTQGLQAPECVIETRPKASPDARVAS
ncbi:MAG TPA: hypothetical protein VK009_13100 [Chloroflexota bacterium]|nr:hypothetical protein [Chloroflexota bacterium]